jgi:periplasmic divalent cation tolerance protein
MDVLDGEVIAVFCTVPVKHTERIAEEIVNSGLSACVSVARVKSFYLWEGEMCRDDEDLMVIKTTSGRYRALEEKIKEIHPYDLPEIIAFPVCAGSEDYLSWVRRAASL